MKNEKKEVFHTRAAIMELKAMMALIHATKRTKNGALSLPAN